MKVTQEEFDAKREDLNVIQKRLNVLKRSVDSYKSVEQELQDWLISAWVEKDLSVEVTRNIHVIFLRRGSGKYKNKGLFLTPRYNWEIKIDDEGIQVAVPTKKP